jgi:hypothetical protein
LILNDGNNTAYSQRVLQTYENEKYGIKMQYPANWESYEYKNFVDETGELVVHFHPSGKEEPVLSLLVLFLLPENATLQSFTEQNLKSIQTPDLNDEVIKILNQNSFVTLGGQPAHQVIYENTFIDTFGKSQTSKKMSIWTVLDTEAYQLTFTTSSNDKEQYDTYSKTAEKIKDSFQFTR